MNTIHNLVIVESPAKAKTIEKYLGDGWQVLASFGHVRDLVQKDGSVNPSRDFEMNWVIDARAIKTLATIKAALKGANTLYLAPDPDREGEAIAWHLQEILTEAGALKNKTVQRVTFNSITKSTIAHAFANPRMLNAPLVEAYLARRALDYLVGFTLSPVLWRKLPGARSAGRVQSVALRLICERETEIEAFRTREYWQITAHLHTARGAPFTARLTHLAGNKLDKFDIPDASAANAAVARVESKALCVQNIERKDVRRSPPPPFITSSLQMEAARKLGLTAARTMRIAQGLYEAGHITYMRTDGTTLSPEAVSAARDVIKKEFGAEYVPEKPRLYKSKAKNAQEAHEAIRPTDMSKKQPSGVEAEAARLYDLIWKRTVASQMENAHLEQVAVTLSDGTEDAVLRANGQVLVFDGFLILYNEDKDDEENEDTRRLPPMEVGEATKLIDVIPSQHFTQPPPRYSEATLVKRLEELGIGRPSTYASILQVLRDRDYVTMEAKRFVPQDRGRIVTTFLAKFFGRYVDYAFTATLEEELDAIAAGDVSWRAALEQFWKGFSLAVAATKDLTITQVIDLLETDLGPHLFPEREDGKDPRICPSCNTGRLGLRLGKFGAFIGCSAYPECKHTRPLVATEGEREDGAQALLEPKILGTDTNTNRIVSLRKGPYGPYVQLDVPEGSKDKPKRQGLPRGVAMESVTLESALALLALPRTLGVHPETHKDISAGVGRFGPYLKHDGAFTSLPKEDDVLSVSIQRAIDILAEAAKKPKRPRPISKTKKSPSRKSAKIS